MSFKVTFDTPSIDRHTCAETYLLDGWYRGKIRGFLDIVFCVTSFDKPTIVFFTSTTGIMVDSPVDVFFVNAVRLTDIELRVR
jgi:hypothetical protein